MRRLVVCMRRLVVCMSKRWTVTVTYTLQEELEQEACVKLFRGDPIKAKGMPVWSVCKRALPNS
eukprot:273636-Chlamydomonas_euryale.AAC.8